MSKKWLTTKDAAKRAEVTLATMVNWCRRFQIAIKVGGRWRVDPEALDRMLKGELQQNEKNNQARREQRPPRRVLIR